MFETDTSKQPYPNLYYQYRGYIAGAIYDYNVKKCYTCIIPAKNDMVFETTAKTFEEDVRKHVDLYIENKTAETVEYIALINAGGGTYFDGTLPDLDDAMLSGNSFLEILYNLTRLGKLELLYNKEGTAKPSKLKDLKVRDEFLLHSTPIIILLEK